MSDGNLQAGPGNRLPDPTNPGIVMRGGRPLLAYGSIGMGLHQKTIQMLHSIPDFDYSPAEAASARRTAEDREEDRDTHVQQFSYCTERTIPTSLQLHLDQHRPMAKPRKRLVSLRDTPYYHCICRCVRRAYLCGVDPTTGFDFSHRRGWIVNRIKQLADVFAIDVYAYAVMSNHYHIVVKIDARSSADWADQDVADRWLRLFKGPEIVRRWAHGEPMDQGEMATVATFINEWRRRLADLSWFMRCLNETIARMANREDECKGRFWEGRFKSQALLDERALLACMAYVDLNPIRVGVAQTPETSEYTSVQERIANPNPSSLNLFQDQSEADSNIPFRLQDYLTLVDWSGRAIRADKPGYIPPHAPPILERLGMERSATLDYVRRKYDCSTNALGPVSRVRAMARSAGLKFIKGTRVGQRLCPEAG